MNFFFLKSRSLLILADTHLTGFLWNNEASFLGIKKALQSNQEGRGKSFSLKILLSFYKFTATICATKISDKRTSIRAGQLIESN